MPNNTEFLDTLFREDAPWVHVTDFLYDPGNIPSDKQLSAWRGNYFSRYNFTSGSNQYFVISNFYAHENVARRRKSLFRHTRVIVLDDVKEKLPLDQVSKLPDPTWILETSPGSEQWGYLLESPCTDKTRVDNLLDGLVANGLAPGGKDPGMKGVTRYVRLPDGYNTKASKMVDGKPFKCHILKWAPFTCTTLEALAEPFGVDLNALRRDSRVDGAKSTDDHPILNIPDLIHIKDTRGDGRYDIICPWVGGHTGEEDTGTVIFTNADGTIGFKCHHGTCQNRTGGDLLQYIEQHAGGFANELKIWQQGRMFSANPSDDTPDAQPDEINILNKKLTELKSMSPFTQEARDIAGKILKCVDSYKAMDRLHWHDNIRDTMQWNKVDFKNILSALRSEWYNDGNKELNFFDEVIYIAEQNQFFNREKGIFYTADAYQNAYAHLDSEARKQALQGGMVTKVDKLDYAPLEAPVFVENGISYGNSWTTQTEEMGSPGDVSIYLEHFIHMGWEKYRDHILQWMAFTIRHPDEKINHMMLFGSPEGSGKDWLLTPLALAMGNNHLTISGDELLRDFDDYLLSTKYLHINEVEVGLYREAKQITAKLKPLAAAPPLKLRVNQKMVKPIQIRNIVNTTMCTNSQLPLRLTGSPRRFFAIWSDLDVHDENGGMLISWEKYWDERWHWMKNGGAQAVVHYLRNKVDLSKFNPGAHPIVTDYLRKIVDSSKTVLHQTIEEFIRRRFGHFSCDLTTVADMLSTLKSASFKEEWSKSVYVDPKTFTPNSVGAIIDKITTIQKKKVHYCGVSMRLIILRDVDKYKSMSSSELFQEYNKQLKRVATQKGLMVVT